MAKKHSKAVKQQIVDRAARRCEYCQSHMDFSTQSFEIEHIIPSARGGTSRLDNLALACGGCNRHKYAKVEAQDPVSLATVSIFNPRNHGWDEHFMWSDDYLNVVGVTAIGRATVESLQLNRAGVVNLRKLMYLGGYHPPVQPS